MLKTFKMRETMEKVIKKIGYARVSQKNQDYENQVIQIKNFDNNIDRFVNEKISSGKKLEDRELYNLINSVEENTIIYVTNLDRLARSVSEIEKIIEICIDRNIIIHIIKIDIKLQRNMNHIAKMFVQIMGSFSEMEKEHIKDRINDGVENARKRGVKFGRKKGSKSKSKLEVYKKEIMSYRDKGLTPKSIKKLLGDRIEVTEMTIYRFLKKNNSEINY